MKIARIEDWLTNARGGGTVRRVVIDPNREEPKSRRFERSTDILVIAALGIVAFALYSIRLKQDINWDLQNYHYYTAHAFLNGRLKQDLLPTGIQSYLNPFPYVHPRRSPKSGHLWSPQNRPLNSGRSVRDIDGAAKPFRLARHEQCLERRKTTTSTRPWATSVVAATHRGTDWCSPRDRQCVSQSGRDRSSRPWSPGPTKSLNPNP